MKSNCSEVAPVAMQGGSLISNGAVSGDGRWLITGELGRLNLLHMRLEELTDLACRTAGRNLSEEEWKTYFPGQVTVRRAVTCPDQR